MAFTGVTMLMDHHPSQQHEAGLQQDHWPQQEVTSGQSYKHFTIVIYDPRVVIWSIFKSGQNLQA